VRPSFALLAALAFVAAAAPASARTTLWCSSELPTGSEQTADATLLAYQRARSKLCAGDVAGAVSGLAAIAPAMKATHRNDGTHYLDFARSYFYALLAARHDAEARRFLSSVERDQQWKPATAERLFWKGDYPASFAAYVADDARVLRNPDQQAAHTRDPHLIAALQAVRAGKLDAAVSDMKAVTDSASLYALMLGNLYAQKRDWPEAFATWVGAAAAGPEFPMMEWYVFDEWNFAALEMLYYYRAHAPTA